jgi:CO dehydrogenase maturation factor
MSITIAVSGKGGAGKTTIAAMIMRELIGLSSQAVLGVDADPNSCLAMTLGVESEGTISKLREDARSKDPSNAGIDRLTAFEYGLEQVLTESKGFDLVTMGHPEGRSCYCAANNLLRKYLDKLSLQYSFVVMDNEAGMEHLSRRTTNDIDLLCIVADPGPIGEMTVRRISELTKTLETKVKSTGVIWNRSDSVKELDGIENFGAVPYDKAVLDAVMQGGSIFDVDSNSPAITAVRQILNAKLDLKN